MDLRTTVESGPMTLTEAAELSRLLEQRWGIHAVADEERGDLATDFLLPLMTRYAAQLTSPEAHLASLRANLARAAAR